MAEFNDINLPGDFDDLSKHAPLLHSLRGKGDGLVVPENYFSETGELLEAKTALPASDGFVVPENYFEGLAERILAAARLSELNDRSQPGGFTVPENYFEELGDKLSPLASLHALKGEPFDIPENYFDGLNETLRTKLALDNLKQDSGFTVPEGYFEKLTGQVTARASAEALQTGSDADVPEGYFDSLAGRIATRIATEENTGQTDVRRRSRVIVFAEVVKRYARPAALAASAALLVAVSVWFLNRGNSAGKTAPVAQHDPQQPKTVQPVAPQQPAPLVQQPDSLPQPVAVQPAKPKKQRILNPAPAEPVKVEKQDVMEQLDLLDESAVAEALDETVAANPANEDLDAIRNELINGSTELPSELFDGGMQ